MTSFWRGLLAAVVCVGLWGCAAQTAYREGQAKVAEGQFNEALERFREAARLEPGSAEYRVAFVLTRDRIIEAHLARAAQAAEKGELIAAERDYRAALVLNGSEERALAGLRQLDQRRRWDRTLREAETSAAKKDWEDVRVKMVALLRENPNQRKAQDLLRQATDALKRQAEASGSGEKALAAAYRKPVTIEFRDTAIKTIFEVLSRSSGLNFIFDKDVRPEQKASIFLKDSTVEAAINLLLMSNQLEQRVLDGNTLFIYPGTAAKQKEYQQLSVRSFYLAYADAKTVATTLKNLLKLRDPIIDEKLNMVMVRDSPEAIRVAEKVVALHDIPEAEIMLEVEILEVKRTRLLDLGVRWPDQLSLTPLPSTTGGTLTVADLRNLNSSTVGAGVGPVTINAKKTDTDANILANPRIRARNREKAKVHIGERVPNITTTATSTGFVAESVNYVDVGLKLDVEPTVYLDNEVAIKVALEVSNIISQVQTKSGTLAYQIGTRTASTVLRLKDGENQVLAGLINDEDRRAANKVPGLGEIPVLGRLFGSQADDSVKTEIVLSITPHVLRNVQRPDAAGQQFDSGTEINTGSRGADLGSAAGAPARGTAAAGGVTPPVPAPAAVAPVAGVPAAAAMGTENAAGLASAAVAGNASGISTLAGSTTQPANTMLMRWEAPRAARVGDTVTVNLYSHADQPVAALQMVLGLDAASATVASVAEGSFLRQGGGTTSFNSQVDPSGQVLVTAIRNGGGGASAEAPLLSLNARITSRPASGELRLQVVNAAPVGLQGRAMAAQLPAVLSISVLP
ncbi:MAG TPA: secretin N-terminal domain-containing protein [Rhizobacter sp.]|nr:secretin N-terminal domain-containing protein [Rhizobacter sp.]